MNILDAAYRIGQQMKTTSIGREWLELYTQLSKSISQDAWNTLIQTPGAFMHYFSFPYALDVIEGNSTRTDLPQFLQDQLQELKASQPLKHFSELSVTLGRNLDELMRNALQPYPIPKDFGDIRATPKLSRSIQDIHHVFQRSGILKSLMRYIDPKTKEMPSIVSTFNQAKSTFSVQLDPKIRKLVREVGTTEKEKKMLTVVYLSDLILEIARQMVFESHLQQVVNIASESIVRSVVKDINGIRPVYLSLDETMLSHFNKSGHFMTVWLGEATQTVIMTRRKLQFGQNVPDCFKMTIKGYLYPENEMNLLNQFD